MRAGQAQPEPFGACGQLALVAAAVEEVVDELPAGGLLLADHQPLGALVAVGERVHGLLDDGEDAVRVGRPRPVVPSGHEMRPHQRPPAVPGLGGARPERPTRLDLVPRQSTTGGRGVREHLLEPVEEALGRGGMCRGGGGGRDRRGAGCCAGGDGDGDGDGEGCAGGDRDGDTCAGGGGARPSRLMGGWSGDGCTGVGGDSADRTGAG